MWMLQINRADKYMPLAHRDQNQMGQGIIVDKAKVYWINMKAGSCSAFGRLRTNFPIQALAYDLRSQVKLVGRPAAILSARRTVIMK